MYYYIPLSHSFLYNIYSYTSNVGDYFYVFLCFYVLVVMFSFEFLCFLSVCICVLFDCKCKSLIYLQGALLVTPERDVHMSLSLSLYIYIYIYVYTYIYIYVCLYIYIHIFRITNSYWSSGA